MKRSVRAEPLLIELSEMNPRARWEELWTKLQDLGVHEIPSEGLAPVERAISFVLRLSHEQTRKEEIKDALYQLGYRENESNGKWELK